VTPLHDRSRPERTRPVLGGERGFVVVGTLLKTLLALAILAGIGYDGFSIMTTHLKVREHAQAAAREGYTAYKARETPQAAFAAVVSYAETEGDTVVPDSFAISERSTVNVSLQRVAPTFFARYVPGLSDYTVAVGAGSAGDPLR
jgi:hypothetical protein